MAMALGGGSEGGGRSKTTGFTASSDINVTPFVDVMLVLLIIFMVAVPLASVDVKVNFPDSNAPAESKASAPVWISMTKAGGYYIGNSRFPSIGAVGDQLEKDTPPAQRDTTRLFLRGDADLPYKSVLELMNVLRDRGFYKISLVGHEAVK
jgi:biopolymer transport protein ExbD